MEKIQKARNIGVLIADVASRTVLVKIYFLNILGNFANIVEFLMRIAKFLNVSLTFISVGKINEAKISNFNDLDGFIFLSCHNVHPNMVFRLCSYVVVYF